MTGWRELGARATATIAVWAIVSAPSNAASDDVLKAWFGRSHCRAQPLGDVPPVVKTGTEKLVIVLPIDLHRSPSDPWYVYDRAHGIAFRHSGADSGITDTIRFAGRPPVATATADLLASHTSSGLHLGSNASAVVAALGRPEILTVCGVSRYAYVRVRDGQPDQIFFTIENGRVVEIEAETEG